MRPTVLSFAVPFLVAATASFVASQYAIGTPPISPKIDAVFMNNGIVGARPNAERLDNIGTENKADVTSPKSSRTTVLVASLTVLVLSIFVGFEIISNAPPSLHTPLMSGTNAISGITIVGAILAAGNKEAGLAGLLGLVAIVLAMINVVGGFVVTHRMLLMFKQS